MPYRYKKKYRLKAVPILTLILIILMIIFAFLFVNRLNGGYFSEVFGAGDGASSNKTVSESSGNTSKDEAALEGVSSDGQTGQEIAVVKPLEISNSYDTATLKKPQENDPLWSLILLNPGNGITEEIPMERTKFNEQYLDSRAAQSYKAMYDAAKADGINLFLRSGYRTLELQKSYYDANIAAYKKQGLSEADAIKRTREYYTVPGHSEHHSGLAADIITDEYQRDITVLDERFASTDGYKWLIKNCADYGFILRYPKEKEDVTQINFESWHYRYVGVAHAKTIMLTGVSLEEYLESMRLSFEKNSAGLSREAFAEAFPEAFLKQW